MNNIKNFFGSYAHAGWSYTADMLKKIPCCTRDKKPLEPTHKQLVEDLFDCTHEGPPSAPPAYTTYENTAEEPYQEGTASATAQNLKSLELQTPQSYHFPDTATVLLEEYLLKKDDIITIAKLTPTTLVLNGCQFEDEEALTSFGALKTVQSLVLENNTFDDAETFALGYLVHLKQLEFCDCEGVEQFVNFPRLLKNLEVLTFRNMTIPENGWADLAKLSLKALNFYTCKNISDKGMNLLAKNSSVTEITLDNTDARDSTIRALAQKKILSKVDLSNSSNIRDPSPLLRDSLAELILHNCPGIDDYSLRNIDKAKNLRILDISSTRVGEAQNSCLRRVAERIGLLERTSKKIGRLGSLETVIAEKTNFTDTDVANLQTTRNLKNLNLADTSISGADTLMQSIATNLPKLSTLNLSGNPVKASNLQPLSRLPLAYLSLTRCPSLAKNGLGAIVNLVGLQQLDMQNSISNPKEKNQVFKMLTKKLPGRTIYV